MLEGRYPLSPPGTVGNRTKDHHLSEATDHDSSHTVLQPHSATSESSSILHSVQMLASVPDSSRDPVSVGHADRQASSVRDRWLEIGLHSFVRADRQHPHRLGKGLAEENRRRYRGPGQGEG